MSANAALADFAVIGANGFVGRHLAASLADWGARVRAIYRDNWPAPGESLGHGIYAVGLTADFRSKPFETLDAHVSTLSRVLQDYRFESFLYLSSTRIYRGANATAEETALRVSPLDPDRLYDLSKLCGESLCMRLENARFRVARLSNVFGPGDRSQNFLTAVISEVRASGSVTLRQALRSEKDYVHVEDVCTALVHIALNGRHRLYNVASGANTTHSQIAETIERAGAHVSVVDEAPAVVHDPIDVARLAGEMTWQPRSLDGYLMDELAAASIPTATF